MPAPERLIVNANRLSIYLNDHLAAMTAECELAQRCLASNPDPPWAPVLKAAVGEVQRQQEAVRNILADIGDVEDPFKRAAAWAAEKLGRLKPNDSLLKYSGLSRLVELEMLLLGAQARVSLWSTLEAIMLAAPEPVPPYDELRAAAAEQAEQLRDLCTAAAGKAFAEETS